MQEASFFRLLISLTQRFINEIISSCAYVHELPRARMEGAKKSGRTKRKALKATENLELNALMEYDQFESIYVLKSVL